MSIMNYLSLSIKVVIWVSFLYVYLYKSVITGFFVLLSRFSLTERCPMCHATKDTRCTSVDVGNPYTYSSSELIHIGTTYEPKKRIEWYKEQVIVEVRQLLTMKTATQYCD